MAAPTTSEECEENFSAFFIDTASRLNKQPYYETNFVPGACKLALLVVTLILVAIVLFKNKKSTSSSTRAWMCFLCSTTFISRVVFQVCFLF
jgi:hypothetical protein